MKGKKYTEEQIIAVLKEGEAGAKVAELCRKYGMSEATYYNWKDTPFSTPASSISTPFDISSCRAELSYAKIVYRHQILVIYVGS